MLQETREVDGRRNGPEMDKGLTRPQMGLATSGTCAPPEAVCVLHVRGSRRAPAGFPRSSSEGVCATPGPLHLVASALSIPVLGLWLLMTSAGSGLHEKRTPLSLCVQFSE